jgi:hypothetical protein
MSEQTAPGRKGLGVIIEPDARDYPMQVSEPATLPSERIYKHGPIRDQGDEGACVGFAGRAYLDATPVVNQSGPGAWDLYISSQKRDRFPDEPEGAGTTAHALAKELEHLGYIQGSYVWARSKQDVYDWVRGHGPVVLATRVTRGCYSTDRNGYWTPRADTAPIGGHCYLILGVLEDDTLLAQNSWGSDFGDGGLMYIRPADLDYLLSLGSWEGMAATEIDKNPEPTEPKGTDMQNLLVIQGKGPDVPYSVHTSGESRFTDRAGASIQANDSVTRLADGSCVATGAVSGGTDALEFDGEILSCSSGDGRVTFVEHREIGG